MFTLSITMAVRRMKRVPRRPRRKAARKGRRKTTIPRGINDGGQVARIKETIEFQNVTANNAYGYQFTLNQFIRASAIAPNFKWYKASKVEWTLEPFFNTFTDDGTPQSVPYLYQTMNRTQDNVALNLQDFQAMGAKPQKLTSKKVLAYKPNWCVPGMLTYEQTPGTLAINRLYSNGLKAVYDWLACPDADPGAAKSAEVLDPIQATLVPLVPQSLDVITNQVVYSGHTLWLDQALPGSVPVARMTCTVHWEFKGPHCTYAIAADTIIAQPAKVPAADALGVSQDLKLSNS